MATFYLDFENGNDASAGTSWATAWKTLNNGATAARIAPGDTIRIAKTADPVSVGNATWTNKSATVTLATAQTTTIDNCETAWTAANTATVTRVTTAPVKQGTYAAQIVTPASTTTTTKYAYFAVGGAGGLDLSAYQQISFWFYNNTSAIADSNRYVIKLCSDTTGDTAVDEFSIPAVASTQWWLPLVITKTGGGNLGNAIKSIALYTGSSSPGNSQQIRLDNILATSNNGLNLTSLISKNSTASGGDNTWHGLQSIDGTTIILGQLTSTAAGATTLKGYWTGGTTPETVTTYIRPTTKWIISTTFAQPLQDSGTAGNLITYSGGWNTSSNTQDGMTYIDGQSNNGYGIYFNNKNYIKIERLGLVRFNTGVTNDGVSTNNCEIVDCECINNSYGFKSDFTTSIITIKCNNNATNIHHGGGASSLLNLKCYNGNSGINIQASHKITNLVCCNETSSLNLQSAIGILIDTCQFEDNTAVLLNVNTAYIKDLTIKNNTGTTGLNNLGNLTINKLTASNNAALSISRQNLVVKQTNATSSNLVGSSTDTSTNALYFSALYNAVNNNINDNRGYWRYGNALSQTTTRHTASGIAWQINITNTAQTSDFPFYFPIAKVACSASSLVTVKAWVKLSHATDIGAKLIIQANEIAGVDVDKTATKTADTNWEELTITFTPTVAGVAQIYLQGYWLANLADESIFVDDITVTQA